MQYIPAEKKSKKQSRRLSRNLHISILQELRMRGASYDEDKKKIICSNIQARRQQMVTALLQEVQQKSDYKKNAHTSRDHDFEQTTQGAIRYCILGAIVSNV